MDLFEYEGKRLLSEHGIPTPKSSLIYSADEQAPLQFPFVLKAQVLTGGRGKAGGIKVCSTQQEYKEHAKAILGMHIKGQPVYALLAEEMASPSNEIYLSVTVKNGRPLFIASAMGGVDIEEVAKSQPDKILTLELDIFYGLHKYQLNRLAAFLPMLEAEDLKSIANKLFSAFCALDAKLIEINPLGVINGKAIALDAKVTLDDDAEKPQKALFAALREDREKLNCYSEPVKEDNTITFVQLEGNIGLISDGAGTGMLALDMVYNAGGHVASFCELGGITNADVMHLAMEKTFFPGNTVKSLLIVLIGGFNRMDDMANGITAYMKAHKLDIPVFTRMCGTMEEEGERIMRENGLTTYRDLTQTVQLSVSAAKEV